MSLDSIVLPMNGGDGESSYAANSRIQEKGILKSRPLLHEAAVVAASGGQGTSTVVVADLGCSSGANTLLVVSEVLSALGEGEGKHIQFFLNDLPTNDFNLVFRSLELFHEEKRARRRAPPYYVAGLPGSFYTRLFPDRSVHLFHSSYCLMIRSKVPDGVAGLNVGNMYIWETTPLQVVKLYQEQFVLDFSHFLNLRHSELVANGRMVLTFQGRKNGDVRRGQMSYIMGLLSHALQSLVQQGRVAQEKLDSFNLPLYAPSVDEVEAVIRQTRLFDVVDIQISEPSWDPQDESDGDVVLDSVQSGINIARALRSVLEPLLARHFGEHMLDDLFQMYARNLDKHLQNGKAKYAVLHLSLKAIEN